MGRITTALLFSLLITFPCAAWGPTGHRVTGKIADQYLTKKARLAVGRILKGQSLAIASTWMDEVRSDSTFQYMNDWHWVTIPEGTTYDRTVKNPNGDIVQTLMRVISELKTRKLSPDQERDYLRILIHLTGDIHQPLHVGAYDDRGGNEVKVMWFQENSNLHRVWDSDIIDDSRLSYSELAQSLDTPGKEVVTRWQRSTILEWAAESQAYSGKVYDTGNGKLGYRYAYVTYPIIRHRLLQAGVRLAGVLNEIYG